MRVLLATCRNPHFPTITEYVEAALRGEGCAVDFFDDRAFLLPGRVRERAPYLQSLELSRLNRRLAARALASRPDLLLVMGGTRIAAQTLERARQAGIKTALWTIDPLRDPDISHLQRTAPLYDHVFCGGTEALGLLPADGPRRGHWLPFGFAAGYHAPAAPRPDLAYLDLCFIGSHYPNRASLFECLTEFKLRIWGPGWEKVPSSSPLKGLAAPGQIKPGFWMQAYASAKIVLCAHAPGTAAAPCYQASPRVFEALATGAFLLCDDQKDVAALFQDGRHLALYKDAGELREKARYYLGHPAERLRIAEQGRQAVLAGHSYSHRMKSLLAAVSAP